MNTTKNMMAIAINKSICKEYSNNSENFYTRTVYLNDGDEFQIQLFNPEQNVIGAEIYINDDKELFFKFKESSAEIEEIFGAKLEWIEASKACRILGMTTGDIKKGTDAWPALFDWYMQAAVKMRKIAENSEQL